MLTWIPEQLSQRDIFRASHWNCGCCLSAEVRKRLQVSIEIVMSKTVMRFYSLQWSLYLSVVKCSLLFVISEMRVCNYLTFRTLDESIVLYYYLKRRSKRINVVCSHLCLPHIERLWLYVGDIIRYRQASIFKGIKGAVNYLFDKNQISYAVSI